MNITTKNTADKLAFTSLKIFYDLEENEKSPITLSNICVAVAKIKTENPHCIGN